MSLAVTCPTCHRVRTYQWWRADLINLDAHAAYRAESRAQATEAVMTRDGSEEITPGLGAGRRVLDEEYVP